MKTRRANVEGKHTYFYIEKARFPDHMILALVLFSDTETGAPLPSHPELYIIRACDWPKEGEKNHLLANRDYKTGKSKPEYGVNLDRSNARELLKPYRFDPLNPRLPR